MQDTVIYKAIAWRACNDDAMMMPSDLCGQFKDHILEEAKHILLTSHVTGKDTLKWVLKDSLRQILQIDMTMNYNLLAAQLQLQAYKDSAHTAENETLHQQATVPTHMK